uniref:AD domain-containing protein n=1 Tax=Ciona savignyi TaxID=51511 RepID=H2Y9W9_CIOSA
KEWVGYSVNEILKLLNTKVEIVLKNGKKVTGSVYTIDPVTHTIVVYQDQKISTIFGHSVKSVEVLIESTQQMREKLDKLLEKNEKLFDHEYLRSRKLELEKWFVKNRIPIEISDDKLCVADVVTILPPYDVDSCHASNEIILSRIQKLISTMPQ